MRSNTRHRPGYAGRWFLSYILPVVGGLALYLPTHSAAAAVIGTVAGFILFAVLASGMRR